MEKDARLEAISDKIRMGIPVGILEAIEAIEYQDALRREKRQTVIGKILSVFSR
jgi:hypothetical protein